MGAVTRIKSTGDLLTDGIGYDFPEEIRGGRNLLLKTNQQFDWVSTSFGQSLTKTTTGMTAFPGYSSLRGKTLTLSLDVNTTNLVYGTTNPWLGAEIRFNHPNGEYTFVSLGNKIIASGTSGEWIRYSWSVTLPDKEIVSSSTLTVLMRDATGSASIKNIKLEIGDKSTPWTPAPEDLGLTYPNTVQEFRKTELYEFPENLRGGRNLLQKNYMTPTSKVTNIVSTGFSSPGDWAYPVIGNFNLTKMLKPNTTYTCQYKYEVLEVSPNTIAYSQLSHASIRLYNGVTKVSVYLDDEYPLSVALANNWKVGDIVTRDGTFTTPSDLTDFTVIFYTSRRMSSSDNNLFVKNDAGRFFDIKFEEGTTQSPYTPAPEDLGLSYPNWLQNFTESFSDKAIVCGEFVEDSTKINPISLKQGNITIKGAYQEGVTL